MSAFNLSGSEDDRIGPTAPRPKPPSAGAAAPGTRTGTRAVLQLLRNFAVLAMVAAGTFALCQLLLFSRVISQ